MLLPFMITNLIHWQSFMQKKQIKRDERAKSQREHTLELLIVKCHICRALATSVISRTTRTRINNRLKSNDLELINMLRN